MNKVALLIFAFCILCLTNINAAYAAGKVDVVVVGYLTHGPMQPSITAIKEVTSKYGDQISVTWMDLDTAEGKQYSDEHGLSAHLNILINGHYQFLVNGRKVTFQWFEGTEWTRNDLDTVLSALLNNTGNVTSLANAEGGGSLSDISVASIILAIVVIVGVFLYVVRKKRKRRKKR
jgi:hypothetical protein